MAWIIDIITILLNALDRTAEFLFSVVWSWRSYILELSVWSLLLMALYCVAYLVFHTQPSVSPNRERRRACWETRWRRRRVAVKCHSSGKLHMFVCTWNAGDADPSASEWSKLFADQTAEAFDVCAFSVQECVHAEAWVSSLDGFLKATHVRVALSELRDSIRLAVYVKAQHRNHISDIETFHNVCGLPIFIRKGGSYVHFRLYSTSIGIIGVHLAAHRQCVVRRDLDLRDIFWRLPSTLIANHYNILMGDLNYRVDMDPKDAFRLISARGGMNEDVIEAFQEKDQLNDHRKRNLCLSMMEEDAIAFAPTFKLKRGTDNEYSSKRTPSWCDRILFMSSKNVSPLKAQRYNSVSLRSSDHLPVVGEFVGDMLVPETSDVSCANHMIVGIKSITLKMENHSFDRSRFCLLVCGDTIVDFVQYPPVSPVHESVGAVELQYPSSAPSIRLLSASVEGTFEYENVIFVIRDLSSFEPSFLLGCASVPVPALLSGEATTASLYCFGRSVGEIVKTRENDRTL